jgi:hypothetical protein
MPAAGKQRNSKLLLRGCQQAPFYKPGAFSRRFPAAGCQPDTAGATLATAGGGAP